jgi:hypothetical protein
MKNINKQEELVSALWDFAKGLQKSEVIKSNICVKSVDKAGFETNMDMAVFDETLKRIAKNFNLEIQPIQ